MHARLPIAALLAAASACAATPAAAPPVEAEAHATAHPPVPAPRHEDLRALRLDLRDGDPAVRLAAAHGAGLLALRAASAARPAAAGDEAEALDVTLAGALATESDPAVRRALVWSMGRRGGPIDALLREVESANPLLRSEALYALGFAHARAALGAAVRAAGDGDAKGRGAATGGVIDAAAVRGFGATHGTIDTAAGAGDANVRAAAADRAIDTAAVRAAGAPAAALDAIAAAAVRAAGDEAAEVRAAAAWLLARLADPAHEELAAALARDGDPQVRAFAARALGRTTSTPSLLEALLGDPAAIVRVEAARGLIDGYRRAATAGAKGRADLRMEEAFAAALERSAAALARQREAGAGGAALQPLLALDGAALPAAAAETVRAALAAQAPTPIVRAERGAQEGDVVLAAGGAVVHLVLEPGAPAEAFRALVAAGALHGRPLRHDPHAAPGDAMPSRPTAWRRGSVGLAGDGSLRITFARTPELDGIATSIGWVSLGLEALENLPPGAAVERAVLR